MAGIATPAAGGGTNTTAKAANTETSQQPSVGQKEHQKRKRNRSKKKRGKGGVGGVGDGGMKPTGEEDGTNSSDTSFQSFQEGEVSGPEAQPDGSECLPSSAVSAQPPNVGEPPGVGVHTDVHVSLSAAQNESTSTHAPSRRRVDIGADSGGVEDKDGARAEQAAGYSGEVDPTCEDRRTPGGETRRHSAGDAKSNSGSTRDGVSEVKNRRLQAEVGREVGSSPDTNLQPHPIEEGVVPKQNAGCKICLGDQRKDGASTRPAQAKLAEPQQSCSADGHVQDRSGGASPLDYRAKNVNVEEGEGDALLSSDASTSLDTKVEQGKGGVGHGSGSSLRTTLERVALEANAVIETEAEELLVDDIDDESSTLLGRTIEGWTPLMIASGGGRLGVVKVLLEAGAAIHDKDDEFGSNSFMWACGGGHSEIARLMLDHGAKELLQSVNSDMWTPLMVACDVGSLATVQVLVEAGADLAAFNRDVLTAMDIAAERNHLLVECYLRTEGAFSSGQFWSAADTGDAIMISRLLRGNGHLVAALDSDGRTALLRSCVGGHLEVARVLVEAGADVDFQDSSGTSALGVAAVLGDVPLARYLVQTGGARLSVKNKAGWTPLMQAVVKGDLLMTRYLVDRGAEVNDGNPGGESVLDMAKRFSGAELQRYLAAKGGFSSNEVKRQIVEVNHGGRGLYRFW
eukprot:g19205.t1